MPWVDLFQHMNSQPGVSITARGGDSGDSYWQGGVTLDPDVRTVLHNYSCGDPFQEYLPPDGERGGVTYNNFAVYGSIEYRYGRINAIFPEDDGGFAIHTGTRIRARARFVGWRSEDYWSASGAGFAGFIFRDTSGGGLYCTNEFAEFYGIDRDGWSPWSEHEVTESDMWPSNYSEFQGIGHETSWPDDYGPPKSGMEVEWQIWVEPVLEAADDASDTVSGVSVTTDVLANDTIDGRPVSLADLDGVPVITRHPESGTVEVNQDGTITYTPWPGLVGEDSYEYEISLAVPDEPDTLDLCYVDMGEGGHMILPSDELDENRPLAVEDSYGNADLFEYWSGLGDTGLAWSPYNYSINFEDGEQVFIYLDGEVRVATMHEGVKLFAHWTGGADPEMFVDLVSSPWSFVEMRFTFNGQQFDVYPDGGTSPSIKNFLGGDDFGRAHSVEVWIMTEGGAETVCGSIGFEYPPS